MTFVKGQYYSKGNFYTCLVPMPFIINHPNEDVLIVTEPGLMQWISFKDLDLSDLVSSWLGE
jgi:hypothetical protein